MTQYVPKFKLLSYCHDGWPSKYNISPDLREYWQYRASLTAVNKLLLYGCRIVVPAALRSDILMKIHEGHLGILKCQERTRESVWWPGVSRQVEDTVKDCKVCAEHLTPAREPLIQTPLPPHAWHIVGADLFFMDGANYLLVIDYFSRYPEVCKLTSTTSNAVIQAMKNCFSHHGIPLIVRSDNGPQFDSEEFEKFSANYNFEHSSSSPRYLQSNGFVERGVKTVKNLLKKSQDPYLTLLNYRATPLSWCGRSPTELLMGRKVRTTLPQTQSQLIPKWPFLEEFKVTLNSLLN